MKKCSSCKDRHNTNVCGGCSDHYKKYYSDDDDSISMADVAIGIGVASILSDDSPSISIDTGGDFSGDGGDFGGAGASGDF